MNAPIVYILISFFLLVVIAVLFVWTRKRGKKAKFSPLAGLAFAFILAGLIFGEDRLAGYGLLGIGVILAMIDIVRQRRNGQPTNQG